MRRVLAGYSLRAVPILIATVVGCSATSPQWKADWNARVDAAADLMDHPCGDFVFDRWADEFLEGCNDRRGQPSDCRQRSEWVWQRAEQCDAWQAWLLRNHNQRQRSDKPEPETRVQ